APFYAGQDLYIGSVKSSDSQWRKLLCISNQWESDGFYKHQRKTRCAAVGKNLCVATTTSSRGGERPAFVCRTASERKRVCYRRVKREPPQSCLWVLS